ncbi:MAG: phospholipase/carboxylesterase [Cognaticolwellia sp.]
MFLLGWMACSTPSTGPVALSAPEVQTLALSTVVEVTVGTPDRQQAIVVGLHGRGAHPSSFSRVLDGAVGDYRALLPLAPTRQGQGGTWFGGSLAGDPTLYGLGIAERAASLAAWIQEESPTGQAVVFGFSQGGMLAMALAAYHPEKVQGAVAMGGLWPDASPPVEGPRPPVRILHGEADPVVDAGGAISAALRFEEAGYPTELTLYPGVVHSVPPEMRAQLHAAIAEFLGQ